MSKRFVAVLAVIAVAGLAVGAVVATGQGSGSDDNLFARLTGAGERQAGNPADPNGKGSFAAVIDGRRLCMSFSVTDLGQIVAAHIHAGRRGQNNPPLIDSGVTPRSGSAATFGKCVRITRAQARALKRRPRSFYFNVHTTQFPLGAIRGQLHH